MSEEEPDWRIDAVIAVIFVVPQVAATFQADSVGENPILTGVYLQLIGLLFVVSYFYSTRSYVLSMLMLCCEHTSAPVRGRWTAILWGSFAFVIGILAQLRRF